MAAHAIDSPRAAIVRGMARRGGERCVIGTLAVTSDAARRRNVAVAALRMRTRQSRCRERESISNLWRVTGLARYAAMGSTVRADIRVTARAEAGRRSHPVIG